MRKHFIPENIDLSYDNFEKFFFERKALMKEQFESFLK